MGDNVPAMCSWPLMKRRMEWYLIANDPTFQDKEKQSKAELLSSLGVEKFRTLEILCLPKSLKDLTCEEITKLLENYYDKSPTTFVQRNVFYNMKKSEDETYSHWAIRLQRVAIYCRFGDFMERLLVDKFITGLEPGPVKERLCLENASTLTLNKALDLAITIEYMGEDAQGHRSCCEWVYKTNDFRSVCKECGLKNHTNSTKDCLCQLCGERGHLPAPCKNGRFQ